MAEFIQVLDGLRNFGAEDATSFQVPSDTEAASAVSGATTGSLIAIGVLSGVMILFLLLSR